MRTTHLLQGLALLLVTPALVGAVAAEETFVVPHGTTFWTDTPIEADHVVIDGVLTGPGDLVIEATSVVVRGLVQAADGPAAAPVVGDGPAHDGADGGDIVITAERVELAPTGVLRAGSGGGGASILAAQDAQAGDGGHGGSIVVDATVLAWDGLALPGSGGDGGAASSVNAGNATGGDGGTSGDLLVNGEAWPAPQAPGVPSSSSPGWSQTDACAFLEAEGKAGSVVRAACAALQGRQAIEVPGDPCTLLPSADCQDLVARVLGLPDWLVDHFECDLCDARTVLELVTDAIGGYLAWCGLDHATPWTGSTPAMAGPSCADIAEGVGNDLRGLPAWLISGAPGAPGLVEVACAVPKGTEGTPNPTGRGGDGGDACVDMKGQDGDAGKNGSSGFFSCRDGGPGGHGGHAADATAVAGHGGSGLSGGNGGDATAVADGGDGGSGGSGGTVVIGKDCAGGHGGNGGNAGTAKATGGNGGHGVCGTGGSGGGASASANGGSGGAGGSGSPSGLSGVSGIAGKTAGKAGDAGVGNPACS